MADPDSYRLDLSQNRKGIRYIYGEIRVDVKVIYSMAYSGLVSPKQGLLHSQSRQGYQQSPTLSMGDSLQLWPSPENEPAPCNFRRPEEHVREPHDRVIGLGRSSCLLPISRPDPIKGRLH